jgi:MarR family transcriptional regulator, organic hydroperoxide resistance regulator
MKSGTGLPNLTTTLDDGFEDIALPFAESVGYQVRLTNRMIQKLLQQTIEPYGVTLGMWYFLRALWNEDGLTQRELSLIVGTMEPTTLSAIKSMEQSGLVERTRNAGDRRKINIHLTPKGLALKEEMLPLAKHVVQTSVKGFSEREFRTFLQLLNAIQSNIRPILQNDKLDIL